MNSKLSLTPTLLEVVIVKDDSGTTQHYWWEQDKRCLENISIYSGQEVTFPNSNVLGMEINFMNEYLTKNIQ